MGRVLLLEGSGSYDFSRRFLSLQLVLVSALLMLLYVLVATGNYALYTAAEVTSPPQFCLGGTSPPPSGLGLLRRSWASYTRAEITLPPQASLEVTSPPPSG